MWEFIGIHALPETSASLTVEWTKSLPVSAASPGQAPARTSSRPSCGSSVGPYTAHALGSAWKGAGAGSSVPYKERAQGPQESSYTVASFDFPHTHGHAGQVSWLLCSHLYCALTNTLSPNLVKILHRFWFQYRVILCLYRDYGRHKTMLPPPLRSSQNSLIYF